MKLTEKKIATILRQHGYKITPQRRAILSVIVHSEEHSTPSAILQKANYSHPGIGLVTVYRTLEILSKLGLVCRMHTSEGCHSYKGVLLEHHHHLTCTACGRVIEFTDCDLGELEERLSAQTGFKIESHLLEFMGCCRDCQKVATQGPFS